MLSVLFAATFPWLCFLWFPLAFYFIFGVDVKPELKEVDRNTPQIFKNKKVFGKIASKLLILMVVLCLVMCGYGLTDLFIRDYVTCEATYIESEAGNFDGLLRNYVFDINGELVQIQSLREKETANYSLEKGGRYTVTYAKRTNMIVSIDGEEKNVGSEQPMENNPIAILLLVMFVGIAGCFFGVRRIFKRKEY